MFNNFMDYQYQASHKIYTHERTNYSIHLGDVASALDKDFIKNQSIHLVVTAAMGMDQVQYTKDQAKHIIYPLLDAKSENISKFFNQFYELIERQIYQGNILVHCAAGISRSATLVISYLMKKNNWTFKQAIKFVRDKRPIVLPNLGFQRQLKQYEVELNRQVSTSQFERRVPQSGDPSTSEARKHLFSPVKGLPLPDIKNLGQTSFIRSKALERGINIRFEPDIARDFAHRKLQIRTRKSEHDSKILKKRTPHISQFNRDNIFTKIQSHRNKLLQRSNNIMNIQMQDFSINQSNHTKKLSSLSNRSEKRSQQLKLKRNYSNNKPKKEVTMFEDMNRVIVNKLQLNQKRFFTQKNLRIRGLHKLAQL